MFGLDPQNWDILETLVIKPLKNHGARVFIFGSRAQGNHRPFSDVDICFESRQPLPDHILYKIKSDIEDSKLPVKIDLVDVNSVAESFKDLISKSKKAL